MHKYKFVIFLSVLGPENAVAHWSAVGGHVHVLEDALLGRGNIFLYFVLMSTEAACIQIAWYSAERVECMNC